MTIWCMRIVCFKIFHRNHYFILYLNDEILSKSGAGINLIIIWTLGLLYTSCSVTKMLFVHVDQQIFKCYKRNIARQFQIYHRGLLQLEKNIILVHTGGHNGGPLLALTPCFLIISTKYVHSLPQVFRLVLLSHYAFCFPPRAS